MSLTGGDETTQEEPAPWAKSRTDDTWGLFWVSPEERFDELEEGATFGRSDECSFLLEGTSVSRCHAAIEKSGPMWALRDLASRNGVFINGERRELHPLSPQDTLRIGDWVGVVCCMPKGALEREDLFSEPDPDFILSAPTSHCLSNLDSLARSDISIILDGETGTGKEVLARVIHRRSGRSGPLVAINCAAIPEGLAEAQLFGHKKGSFTGALETAQGHIASAHGGTLFLDEIVDLPLGVQSKLLRTLEERTVTPVGASEAVEVDFRLVVASQRPLQTLVETGKFRADLYARLNGVELTLPALRERRQEVIRLLRHFMSRRLHDAPHLDSRLVERLCSHTWPYNVRELSQLARLLAALGRSSYGVDDLPKRFLESGTPTAAQSRNGEAAESAPLPSRAARRALELTRLKQALHATGGNVSQAARQAGIPRHRARRLLATEPGVAS